MEALPCWIERSFVVTVVGVGYAGRVVGAKSCAMFNMKSRAEGTVLIKVLHVIPSVARRYGGPSQAIYTLCSALQAQAVDVLIATTNADGDRELPVTLGKRGLYQGVDTIFF